MDDETLMVEVERIAVEIANKWIIVGPTPEESWIIWRRVCELIGIERDHEALKTNIDEDLWCLKAPQLDGQRREVFCVRLADGLPWALMRIDSSRTAKSDLVRGIQRNLARIITEILFNTGDGQQPASNLRALFGETTGYTLPLRFQEPHVAQPLDPPDLEGVIRGETASQLDAVKYAIVEDIAKVVRGVVDKATDRLISDIDDLGHDVRGGDRLIAERLSKLIDVHEDLRANPKKTEKRAWRMLRDAFNRHNGELPCLCNRPTRPPRARREPLNYCPRHQQELF
jgi:hypothetical protein